MSSRPPNVLVWPKRSIKRMSDCRASWLVRGPAENHPEPALGAVSSARFYPLAKVRLIALPCGAHGATLGLSTAEADAMKISGIRSSIVALPADEPLAGAAENPNGKRPIVTLEVQTDNGAVGVGATYFGGALTGTLK